MIMTRLFLLNALMSCMLGVYAICYSTVQMLSLFILLKSFNMFKAYFVKFKSGQSELHVVDSDSINTHFHSMDFHDIISVSEIELPIVTPDMHLVSYGV